MKDAQKLAAIKAILLTEDSEVIDTEFVREVLGEVTESSIFKIERRYTREEFEHLVRMPFIQLKSGAKVSTSDLLRKCCSFEADPYEPSFMRFQLKRVSLRAGDFQRPALLLHDMGIVDTIRWSNYRVISETVAEHWVSLGFAEFDYNRNLRLTRA